MADSTTRKIVDQPVSLRLTDQDELARRASTLAISKSPKPSDSILKQVDRPSVKPARVVQQYNPDAGFILTMCQLEKACKFMDVEIATLQLAQLLSVTEPGEHEQMIYDCYSDLHMRETGQADYFTDLDRQVLGFGEALLSNPPGGMNDYQLIGSLATSLHNRFVKQEKLSDVNRAIVCHQHALYLVPEDFVDRSEMTYYLGRSFWCRYLHQNKLDDLDQAVECYQLVITLALKDHPMRAMWLRALVESSGARFQLQGDLVDLDRGIACYKDLLGLTPEVGGKRKLIENLATCYTHRYRRSEDLSDIDQAIEYLVKGLPLFPEGGATRGAWVSNIALSFMGRFELAGEPTDVHSAIDYLGQALSLTSEHDASRPVIFSNLGNSHLLRFARLGVLSDLDKTVDCYDQAVALVSDSDPRKSKWLYNLGCTLIQRLDRLGNIEDLEKAITCFQCGISLTPEGHTDRPERLDILGNAYGSRFEHLDQLSDIDEAIAHHREAVLLIPVHNQDRFKSLGNLGNSLACRFERLGELKDLNESIIYQRKCMSLIPEQHSDRLRHLGNLGNVLLHRFERLNEPPDIHEAIECHSNAVLLTSEGDEERASPLSNLASSLVRQFQYRGVLSDIDRAVALYNEAISVTPKDHAIRYRRLNYLASALHVRFSRLSRKPDLEQAIKYQKEAILLLSATHGDMPALLTNLGNALGSRFQHFNDLADIDEAISHHRQVVLLTPEGHADKPERLENLGCSIMIRHMHGQTLSDAEEGITFLQKALSLTPEDHALRTRRLSTLGSALIARYKSLHKPSDVNLAIDLQEQSLLYTPVDHASWPDWLNALGVSFQHRFENLEDPADLARALDLFKQSAQSSSGPAGTRFRAAYRWAKLSRSHNPSSTLDACRRLMDLVPSMVWLGGSINDRYEDVPEVSTAVTEAASAAIECQAYSHALEWLEEGRSIVWKQISQLRTPLEELHRVEPALADRLQEVAFCLENANSGQRKDQPKVHQPVPLEQSAQQHRRLAEEWDQLLQQIHLIPQFQDFLKPKKASELIQAARFGTVVVINVDRSRCDALVLKQNSHKISHVPLSNFSHKKARHARAQLLRSLVMKGVRERGVRLHQPRAEEFFADIFSNLWTNVVQPVLGFLGYTELAPADELPRITWCTTGPLAFLPLHAAGIYHQPHSRIFNYAITSYTPTLGALLARPRDTSEFQGILAVGQAAATGASSLPGTIKELDEIEKQTTQMRFTRLDEERATDIAVLEAMREHSWVHLACHAVQNPTDPMASAFRLHDSTLSLATITKNTLEYADFAFLSACQTAAGDENLPEEAVHLAAGMIMAGYSTVIASMWSIQDKDAPLIADSVYAGLLEGGVADSSRAARALHKAVEHLRADVGESSFASWVPYIHIGL